MLFEVRKKLPKSYLSLQVENPDVLLSRDEKYRFDWVEQHPLDVGFAFGERLLGFSLAEAVDQNLDVVSSLWGYGGEVIASLVESDLRNSVFMLNCDSESVFE